MNRPGPTRVIRIRLHDDQPALVLLDTAPQLAATMGRFPAARYVAGRRGAYALPVDLLDDLATFARVHDVLLIDERVASTNPSTGRAVGPARPAPECAHCGQPARRGTQPAYCAHCGNPWQAIEHAAHAGDTDREQCTLCGATQTPGFGYCQRCGQPITHEPATTKPPPHAATPRAQLQDPLPIGAAVDDVLQQQLQ